MIDLGNDFIEKMVQNEAACPNCEYVFSFEKGVEQSLKFGIESQVVTCPKCNAVYKVDLQLNSMNLLDDVSSRYVELIKAAGKPLEAC